MPKKIHFKTREPIGSSTYPMPNGPVNFDETLSRLNKAADWNKISTIYIHIPFCDQICSFCGFNKYLSPEDVKEDYVEALIKEMTKYANQHWVQSLQIPAVYLGGGTPNSLTANQMDRILKVLRAKFPLTKDCQITCEGTPMNFTEDRIEVLKKNGVERVSAGIQTFNREIREEHLHMRQGKEELLKYIDLIAKHFDSFNLDLIYNLPKQTDEIWADDLNTVLATKVKHLTIYPLVLLEKTMFYSDFVKKNKYPAPDQDREIYLYHKTLQRLQNTPFEKGRYTVRDWAFPGYECSYIQWNANCSNVLAFGAGAHGFVCDYTYKNEKIIKKYIDCINEDRFPLEGQKLCTRQEMMERFTVMGLRLLNLDLTRFKDLFGEEWNTYFSEKAEDMIFSGFIKINNNHVNYTPTGYAWENNVRTYFEGNKGAVVGYTDTAGIGQSGKDHYTKISRVKATDAEIA